MRINRILFLVFAAVLAFALLFVSYQIFYKSSGQNTVIKVYKGESLRSLAYRLKLLGLVDHPLLFELYGRLRGDSEQLKHGEYQVKSNESMNTLLMHIVTGDIYVREFQIIEGWTYRQVRSALLADPHIAHTIKALSPQALMKKIGSIHSNPEGLLFPNTYAYTWGDTDFEIAARAYYAMQETLVKQWQQRAADLPYKSAYQALIVASMIEKETALDRERAEIAGVILRRLKIRMRLQIDPTVVYGLGKPYGTRLTRKDLKQPTAYNTYTNYGLPPTPIDMPSLASIIAALHPKDGTALYYVAKEDGSHQFSDTYLKHRQAIAQYLRKKDKSDE